MIKIEYEKTMDTINDMLQSEMPIMSAKIFKYLTETDPRKKVKALSEKVEWYAGPAQGEENDRIDKG